MVGQNTHVPCVIPADMRARIRYKKQRVLNVRLALRVNMEG